MMLHNPNPSSEALQPSSGEAELREKIEKICVEYFGLSTEDEWDMRVTQGAVHALVDLIHQREKEVIKEAEEEWQRGFSKVLLKYPDLLKEVLVILQLKSLEVEDERN